MKKTIFRNIGITCLYLMGATILAFLFFYFGHKNSGNIAVIYILALILIALNTQGYVYGIFASLFCVAAVNVFFTYPFFEMDFSLDGYPVTFVGMLAITLITSTITTRIKKQKAILEEREKKLAETEKERIRANLLRAISHDLRTPLTSIIGSSSSFLEDQDSLTKGDCAELMGNINEDAHWLLNMVENLLTVTRIQDDSGKVKKSLEVVEEVVAEAITRVQKRHASLAVHVDMPADFLMIGMDATLIEQVLINLLENALIHANSQKAIELLIRNGADAVTFQIRDYGVGLDESQLPFLFEGTYSSDSADGHRGIGIGLSICQTIIRAHDGELTASNHDDGADFTFTLPKGEGEEYGS